MHKAFQELIKLGLVEDKPYKVFGAQATGCSPVSVAYKAGVDAIRPVKPDTIAKSLAIGNPADGIYVLDICRATGGAVEDITDDEVRDGIVLLARTEGIFTETAGGTTVGVLKKLVETGQLDPTLETVVINTGTGLKTLDAVSDRVGPAATIEPTYAAFAATGIWHRASEPRRHHERVRPRSRPSCAPTPVVSRRSPRRAPRSPEVLDDLDAATRASRAGSSTRTASCAASSTSTSATTTCASSTTSTTADARRHPDLGDPGGRRRLISPGALPAAPRGGGARRRCRRPRWRAPARRAPRRTGRRAEQLGAGGGQPVAGQRRGRRAAPSPASGPSASADGDRAVEPDHRGAGERRRARRSASAIRDQSVSSAARAIACSAAISAWSRYGAAGRVRQRREQRRAPR